jgi:SAM-dependent methyltransferase
MHFLKKLIADKQYKIMEDRFGLDAPEMTLYHRTRIVQKKFLKQLYTEWYTRILSKLENLDGEILEIGSGGGFLKEIHPRVITSDVLPLPHCDLVLPASQLPFADNTLSAIVMIDTLHHIGDSENFFREAERALKFGGKIIMIEPANTLFSRFIFKNFHHEPFDENSKEWSFPSSAALSQANGALPWIIFGRDTEKFHSLFPQLDIKSIDLHTPFRYIMSGGMPYKPMVPFWMFSAITYFERLLSPFSGILAMFQTIEIIKR